jgi:Mg2+-importing ATPase
MIRLMIILVMVIFTINAVLKGNVIEAILFALAVAVGHTPEMLEPNLHIERNRKIKIFSL